MAQSSIIIFFSAW